MPGFPRGNLLLDGWMTGSRARRSSLPASDAVSSYFFLQPSCRRRSPLGPLSADARPRPSVVSCSTARASRGGRRAVGPSATWPARYQGERMKSKYSSLPSVSWKESWRETPLPDKTPAMGSSETLLVRLEPSFLPVGRWVRTRSQLPPPGAKHLIPGSKRSRPCFHLLG